MQLYTFWARDTAAFTCPDGRAYALVAYAGSNLSPVDASTQAQQKLLHRQRRLERGEQLREYPTGAKPLREKVERRLHDAAGAETAAITRNAYGALVLNTRTVMFIDVDLADLRPARAAGPGFFKLLLQWLRLAPPPAAPPSPLLLLEGRITRWLAQHPAWNFRLYRTRAGYRLVVTHAEISPTDAIASQVFSALGADRLYARMCQLQACYRARLSPKPWRVGLARPPYPFPWQDAQQQQAQHAWESIYATTSGAFSVCEQLGNYGSGQVCTAAAEVLALHDDACLGGRPLA